MGSSVVAPAACRESLCVSLPMRLLPISPAGSNAPNLIIGLTAGPLTPRTFEETKSEVSPTHQYQRFAPCIWYFILKGFFLLG